MSDYYPDWCYGATLCRYEGHEYSDGGACINCGERLRCICGQFVRWDTFERHLLTGCRTAAKAPEDA